MLPGWTVSTVALAYLGLLFAVASYGDKYARNRIPGTGRPVIYALTLGVYCTSWTFFGSVGLSARTGYDFLPIYIGPILMLVLAWPVMRRIAELSKSQNITSIADFISARYGKNQKLAALVTVIAVIGTLPYIALQLKAVALSLSTLLEPSSGFVTEEGTAGIFDDLAFYVALTMAAFSVLFGTRHIDATEHQDGLMLAIAAESVVKLVTFLCVGIYVTFWMFDGFGDLLARAQARPDIADLLTTPPDGLRWITMTLLAMVGIILLPRQFHVAIVENDSTSDIKKAAWLFPLYLVAINIFVIPIAIAGLLTFPGSNVNGDTFVLALPLSAGQLPMTIIAFVGGLSAATAMVIVGSIALSVMVSNNLVVPLILRDRVAGLTAQGDMGRMLLNIRRTAIVAILVLGYVYYHLISGSLALASIGLISFAAIAQFAPVFFGGLFWKRATARGAIAGVSAGFVVWAYTLLLPSFLDTAWFPASLLSEGPFGIAALKPQALFFFETDPISHGVIWSLGANGLAYWAVSLLTNPQPVERMQADIFVSDQIQQSGGGFRLWRTAVQVGDLKETVARYLGDQRTERSFAEFAESRHLDLRPDAEADVRLLRFAENLLASAVGAASSRLVLALLLERHSIHERGAMKLLDDASAAIQYNRDLLQSAIDHVRPGIAVFDSDLCLICWNTQFRELIGLPVEFGRVGVRLRDIVEHMADKGEFGTGDRERLIDDRIERLVVSMDTYIEPMLNSGTVLEVRSTAMPDGGVVATFTDVTEQVEADKALKQANETLERRVRERTAELTELNHALEQATAEAEAANLGKTRFLAAASHDILQPLNAARLYTSSLVERGADGPGTDDYKLIRNIDASLEAVEDILGALLDISRLDAGALKPEISTFRIGDLLDAIEVEFGPLAKEKGLDLWIVPSSLTVRSDRRLARRIVQNLVSNAIKYTPSGRVVVGCRRRGDTVVLNVHDTGIGVPTSKQELIFQEFERLDDASRAAQGLGLGLSIVQRIVQMLGHKIEVYSRPGKGSAFSLHLPMAEAAETENEAPVARGHTMADVSELVVLCIDNEPEILNGMRALLKGWGCDVQTATGLAATLDLLDRSDIHPDVVLADYHLDDENGLDLISELRRKLDRDLPAILITADRSRDLRDTAREQGVFVLNKPVKPAALRSLLAQSRRQMQAAQ